MHKDTIAKSVITETLHPTYMNNRGQAIAIALGVGFLILVAITMVPALKQTVLELLGAWKGSSTGAIAINASTV